MTKNVQIHTIVNLHDSGLVKCAYINGIFICLWHCCLKLPIFWQIMLTEKKMWKTFGLTLVGHPRLIWSQSSARLNYIL